MKKVITRTNTRERLAAKRREAMPEVKAIVSKYGLSIVSGCLIRLREKQKGLKKLEAMKREVKELERKISQ